MNIFSPWPEKGKNFKFIRRPSWHVRCAYLVDNDKDESTPKVETWQWWAFTKEFKATFGDWIFFSMRFGRFGFYIGWKPVNLEDPNFIVPTSFSRAAPACEFSWRTSTNRNEDTDNG